MAACAAGAPSDFARVSLTAATVWASVALYLSIVPSYARVSLDTGNLALLASIAALALVASCVAQVVAQRFEGERRRDQAAGLLLLALGLGALIAGAPFYSLPALLGGAVATGTGHGLAFLNAQQELNELAPSDRRGEVDIGVHQLHLLPGRHLGDRVRRLHRFLLTVSVELVAAALLVTALGTAAWQWRGPESNRRHHGFQPCALPTELPRPERPKCSGGSRTVACDAAARRSTQRVDELVLDEHRVGAGLLDRPVQRRRRRRR